ncbi:MAG TPA: M3 family metallopeptidase, partial [Planctomycetota bacterium]|nr:M3 family metallopeptidase [Planctomycetota bacterium]
MQSHAHNRPEGPNRAEPVAFQSALLAPWKGPYGGVPAFDRVQVGEFLPALDEVLPATLAEIEAIANNPEAPTFENTLVALERSGRALNRFRTYFGVWSGNRNSEEFSKVEQAAAPRFSEFSSQVIANSALFARIAAVHANQAGLDAEQRRLVHTYHTDFVHSGAQLAEPEKARLATINGRLASLYTAFGQNVLADEEGYVLFLDGADMEGVPDWLRASCAQTAEAKGQPGRYAIANSRSSMDPFLTYSPRRDLREKVWSTYYQRGGNGDARDNHDLIAEILRLRQERAQCLGYPNHAAWMLE